MLQTPATAYTADPDTGLVVFLRRPHPGQRPRDHRGLRVRRPRPLRPDKLEINIEGFRHGAIPSIPIVEIRYERSDRHGQWSVVGRSLGLGFKINHDLTTDHSRLTI